MKVQIVGRQRINDSNGVPFLKDEDLRALDGIVRGPVIEVSQIGDVFGSDAMSDFEKQYPNYNNITIEKVEDYDVDNEEELSVDSSSDNVDEDEYVDGNIKVDKGFYTAFELKRKYDCEPKRVILDSDFQRDDVWNNVKRSELIESVLMGLPLPIFYFNQDKYGRLVVVDGRQRLTSMFRFMNDEFRLSRLKVLKSLNGKKFSELQIIQQNKIEDFQIQAHVIIPPTDERVKFDIFDRVNRGGVNLNKQEIRNALHQGKATKLLNEITQYEGFIKSTGGAFKNEKRMKDKYLITRVLAIQLYIQDELYDSEGNKYKYKGDIDGFQGLALDYINSNSDDYIDKLKNKIEHALDDAYDLFGQDGFRLISGEKKTPINMNLFETIMIALMNNNAMTPKTKIRESVIKIKSEEDFLDNIGSHRDGEIKMEWRIKKALEISKGEVYD